LKNKQGLRTCFGNKKCPAWRHGPERRIPDVCVGGGGGGRGAQSSNASHRDQRRGAGGHAACARRLSCWAVSRPTGGRPGPPCPANLPCLVCENADQALRIAD
jgi:hypothetical protein